MQNPRIDGGGPWLLEVDDDLQPGETAVFRLTRMEYRGRKRYFTEWLPMDNLLFKNLNDSNPVEIELNGVFGAVVEPNAADTFADAGITAITVTNQGATELPADDLVIQVSVEPHGADDAARARVKRNPVQNFIRGVLNQ